jgi:phenylacetic acid degradation operon negative regulatory protein
MRERREFLSSIRSTPLSDFVYSAFGWYAPQRGGSLPGVWFVGALTSIGFQEAAIRMTLFRLERSGALRTVRRGRNKDYFPTPTTRAIADTGRGLLFPRDDTWDGNWTVVTFFGPESERLRDVLMVNGFARLGLVTHVHPRDRVSVIQQAEPGRTLVVFRGRPASLSDLDLVRKLWSLDAVASRYRIFIETFAPVLKKKVEPLDAFIIRHAMMFEYFRTTWSDPDLPAAILPRGWPGAEARTVARALYERLLPGATRYADSFMPVV